MFGASLHALQGSDDSPRTIVAVITSLNYLTMGTRRPECGMIAFNMFAVRATMRHVLSSVHSRLMATTIVPTNRMLSAELRRMTESLDGNIDSS